MSNKLIIPKKKNDCKVFSVRVNENIVRKIDEIGAKTSRSRNEIINIFLEYALNNLSIDGKQ